MYTVEPSTKDPPRGGHSTNVLSVKDTTNVLSVKDTIALKVSFCPIITKFQVI